MGLGTPVGLVLKFTAGRIFVLLSLSCLSKGQDLATSPHQPFSGLISLQAFLGLNSPPSSLEIPPGLTSRLSPNITLRKAWLKRTAKSSETWALPPTIVSPDLGCFPKASQNLREKWSGVVLMECRFIEPSCSTTHSLTAVR